MVRRWTYWRIGDYEATHRSFITDSMHAHRRYTGHRTFRQHEYSNAQRRARGSDGQKMGLKLKKFIKLEEQTFRRAAPEIFFRRKVGGIDGGRPRF